MFSYIRGRLVDKTKNTVIIENQGIGFKMEVPAHTLAVLNVLGEEVKLFTYLAVREDALSLYGFAQRGELSLFELLLSVSGVGPKAALAVLSVFREREFYMAVMQEDIRALTRVPGVGPKSAKRLIVELKDKITSLDQEMVIPTGQADMPMDAFSDAMAALVALGYNSTEAQAALHVARGEAGHAASGQEMLKRALAQLSSS
jgi:Holliday junction DNA helicase RuvA